MRRITKTSRERAIMLEFKVGRKSARAIRIVRDKHLDQAFEDFEIRQILKKAQRFKCRAEEMLEIIKKHPKQSLIYEEIMGRHEVKLG